MKKIIFAILIQFILLSTPSSSEATKWETIFRDNATQTTIATNMDDIENYVNDPRRKTLSNFTCIHWTQITFDQNTNRVMILWEIDMIRNRVRILDNIGYINNRVIRKPNPKPPEWSYLTNPNSVPGSNYYLIKKKCLEADQK